MYFTKRVSNWIESYFNARESPRENVHHHFNEEINDVNMSINDCITCL